MFIFGNSAKLSDTGFLICYYIIRTHTNGVENMEALNSLRIAGPLTLDSDSNRAYIVSRTELDLSPDEFEVLYMLATREDVPLTLEQLYGSLWERGDGICRREEARQAMDNIIGQVNAAGNGFVWIERTPPEGYTFRTRWAHNREKWMNQSSE